MVGPTEVPQQRHPIGQNWPERALNSAQAESGKHLGMCMWQKNLLERSIISRKKAREQYQKENENVDSYRIKYTREVVYQEFW